jgi:hypothetical protein
MLRCPECKSTKVHVKAWVNANTNEYIEEADPDYWCEKCQENYDKLEDFEPENAEDLAFTQHKKISVDKLSVVHHKAIKDRLNAGLKLAAVKYVYDLTDLGLKQSKEYIDNYSYS